MTAPGLAAAADRGEPAVSEGWAAATAAPALGTADAHIWSIDLDSVDEPGRRTLAPTELQRARLLQPQQARRRWSAGRATLRALLAGYLGCEPLQVTLTATPEGKPRLEPAGGLRFNVSHSGGLALVAVGAVELGVDVELVRPRPRMAPIARRLLGEAELARIQQLEAGARERELLRAWVRTEAAVKCLGVGLGAAPHQEASSQAEAAAGGLWIADLPSIAQPEALAALAARPGPLALRCLRWPA